MKNANFIIAVSEALVNAFRDFRIPPSKIKVIPTGSDILKFPQGGAKRKENVL